MAHAYTPGLQVMERTRVTKTRTLPLPGEVLVKPGDPVQAETIIARTELPNEVIAVNVVNQLSITPEDINEYMLKKEGDSVQEGEPIAENKPILKWFKSTVKSPIIGTIESISQITGQVLLRKPPRHVELEAYLDGKVKEIVPGLGAELETYATYIQGIFGIGGERAGVLQMAVNSPVEPLTAAKLHPDQKGKIIVGGSFIDGKTLKKAIELGVTGIILGGIDAQDLKDWLGYELGVAITGDEDVTTTLIITEGFGKISMAQRTFDLLKSRQGKRASISGRTQIRAGVMRPEIIISLAETESSMVKTRDFSSGTGIQIGDQIRIIREPYFGKIGKITGLPSELQKVETEAKVRVMEVELNDGQRVILPRANVEIIEG
ncbi:MAG: hypothetical protein QME64_07375 [bacterium]|nr:hypothetical protein [bacterium]